MRRVDIGNSVTLYCGDCRDILPTLGAFDVVITDPPYGIDFPYFSYKDTHDNLAKLTAESLPLMRKASGRVVITPGVSNLWTYPKADWVAAWTWGTTATYGAFGYNQWQPILIYGEDLKGFGSVNGALKSDRIQVNGFSTLDNLAEGKGHTCPKPLTFVQAQIARFSVEADVIVDPFMGSGTTGVGCVKLGRRFVGIEIDERYFDIACRRIDEATRQPDMFAEPPAKAEQLGFSELAVK